MRGCVSLCVTLLPYAILAQVCPLQGPLESNGKGALISPQVAQRSSLCVHVIMLFFSCLLCLCSWRRTRDPLPCVDRCCEWLLCLGHFFTCLAAGTMLLDVSPSQIELDMVQCMVGKCATLVDNLVESGPLPFQHHLQICVYHFCEA